MPEVEFREETQLIEKLCCDQYSKEILRFFARHPNAHFDEQVLLGGLGLNDSRRIEKTLEHLSELNLIEIKAGHGLCIYWLTRRQPLQTAVRAFFALTNNPGDAPRHMDVMQLLMPLAACPA